MSTGPTPITHQYPMSARPSVQLVVVVVAHDVRGGCVAFGVCCVRIDVVCASLWDGMCSFVREKWTYVVEYLTQNRTGHYFNCLWISLGGKVIIFQPPCPGVSSSYTSQITDPFLDRWPNSRLNQSVRCGQLENGERWMAARWVHMCCSVLWSCA